jgi:hypothetical protein
VKSILPFESCEGDMISCTDQVFVYGPCARSSFVLVDVLRLHRPLLLVGFFSSFLSYPNRYVGMILFF